MKMIAGKRNELLRCFLAFIFCVLFDVKSPMTFSILRLSLIVIISTHMTTHSERRNQNPLEHLRWSFEDSLKNS